MANDKFDSIMRSYEKKQKEKKEKTQEKDQARQAFLKSFSDMVRGIIRPCMDKYAKDLESRGHSASVGENRIPGGPSSGIWLIMRPHYSTSSSSEPSQILFGCSKNSEKIEVSHQINKGPGNLEGGPRGSYDIKEINEGVVEELILETIEKVFS